MGGEADVTFSAGLDSSQLDREFDNVLNKLEAVANRLEAVTSGNKIELDSSELTIAQKGAKVLDELLGRVGDGSDRAANKFVTLASQAKQLGSALRDLTSFKIQIDTSDFDAATKKVNQILTSRSPRAAENTISGLRATEASLRENYEAIPVSGPQNQARIALRVQEEEQAVFKREVLAQRNAAAVRELYKDPDKLAARSGNRAEADFEFQGIEKQVEQYKASSEISITELRLIRQRLQRAVDNSPIDLKNVNAEGKPIGGRRKRNTALELGNNTIEEIDNRIATASETTADRNERQIASQQKAARAEEERARALAKLQAAFDKVRASTLAYQGALQKNINAAEPADPTDRIEGRLLRQTQQSDETDNLLKRGLADGRAFEDVLKIREAYKLATAAARELYTVAERNAEGLQVDLNDPIQVNQEKVSTLINDTQATLDEGKVAGEEYDRLVKVRDAWKAVELASQKYYATLEANAAKGGTLQEDGSVLDPRLQELNKVLDSLKAEDATISFEGLGVDEILAKTDTLSSALKGLVGDAGQLDRPAGDDALNGFITDLLTAGAATDTIAERLRKLQSGASKIELEINDDGFSTETASIDTFSRKLSRLSEIANGLTFGSKDFKAAFAGIGQLDFSRQIRQLETLKATQQGVKAAFLLPESQNGLGGAEDPQAALNKVIEAAPKNLEGYSKLVGQLKTLQDVFRDSKQLSDIFRQGLKGVNAEIERFKADDAGAKKVIELDIKTASNSALNDELANLKKLAEEAEFAGEAYEEAFQKIGRLKIAQADRSGFGLAAEQEGRRQYFNEDLGGLEDPDGAIAKIRNDFTKTVEGSSLLEAKLKSLQDVFRDNARVANLLRNALREVRAEQQAYSNADKGNVSDGVQQQVNSFDVLAERLRAARAGGNAADLDSPDFLAQFAESGKVEIEELARQAEKLNAIQRGQREAFEAPLSSGGLGGAEDFASAIQRIEGAANRTGPGLQDLRKILTTLRAAYQDDAKAADLFTAAIRNTDAALKQLNNTAAASPKAGSINQRSQQIAEARNLKNAEPVGTQEFNNQARAEQAGKLGQLRDRTAEAIGIAGSGNLDIGQIKIDAEQIPQTERALSAFRAELVEARKDVETSINADGYKELGVVIDGLSDKLKRLQGQQSNAGKGITSGSLADFSRRESEANRKLSNATTDNERSAAASGVSRAASAGASESARATKALQDAFEAQLELAKGSGTLEQALDKLQAEFPQTIAGLEAFIQYLQKLSRNTAVFSGTGQNARNNQQILQGRISNVQAKVTGASSGERNSEQLLDLGLFKRDLKGIAASVRQGFKESGLLGGLQKGGEAVRGVDEKTKAGLSESLIGGGFPLLFGQGPLAALGGGLGGLLGPALLGGAGGFALSIAGTALGDALAGIGSGAIATAAALQNPIEKFGELSQAVTIGTNSTNSYIEFLISSGRRLEAASEIRNSLIQNTGFGQEQNRDFGAIFESVGFEFTRLGDNVKNLSAVAILPFAVAVGAATQLINNALTAVPRAADFLLGGQAERDGQLAFAKEQTRLTNQDKLAQAEAKGDRTTGRSEALGAAIQRRESTNRVLELEQNRPSVVQRAIALRLGQRDPNEIVNEQIKEERLKQRITDTERNATIQKNLRAARSDTEIARRSATFQSSGAISGLNLLDQRDSLLRNASELRRQSVESSDPTTRNELTNLSTIEKEKASQLEIQADAQAKLNTLKAQELQASAGLRGNALARAQENIELKKQIGLLNQLNDPKRKEQQSAFVDLLRQQQANNEIIRRQDEDASIRGTRLEAANSIRSFGVSNAAADNRQAIARSSLSTAASEIPLAFNSLIESLAQKLNAARFASEQANQNLAIARERPGTGPEEIASLELKADTAAEQLKLAGKDVATSMLEGAKRARERLTDTRISLVESNNSEIGQAVLSPEIRRQDSERLNEEWIAAARDLQGFLGTNNFRGFTITGGSSQDQDRLKSQQIRFAQEQIKLRTDAANLKNQGQLLTSNGNLITALGANTTAVTTLAGKDQNVYIQVSPKLQAVKVPNGIS